MFTITVLGGTGFFGRLLVRRLVAEGATVRVAVRHPEQARSVLHADGSGTMCACGEARKASPIELVV
jgi:nucleoside-diphosphate-sugar epimerase